jgi:hypothetical protein
MTWTPNLTLAVFDLLKAFARPVVVLTLVLKFRRYIVQLFPMAPAVAKRVNKLAAGGFEITLNPAAEQKQLMESVQDAQLPEATPFILSLEGVVKKSLPSNADNATLIRQITLARLSRAHVLIYTGIFGS